MSVFVDTNILLYAYDHDAGDKHNKAVHLIKQLWEEEQGLLSTQVLQEFYVNATRKMSKPITFSEARRIIENYLSWPVQVIEPEMLLLASEIQERHQLSYWDALIVAAARESGADTLYTEDLNHGQAIEGVLVQNPFM